MNADDPRLPEDEEETKVPTGTWASVGADATDLDEKRPSPDPGESHEREARPSRPPPRPNVATSTPRDLAPLLAEIPRAEPDASDSQIRPRFLASELLRRRSESHEPIWPGISRIVGAIGGTAAGAIALAFLLPGNLPVATAVVAFALAAASLAPLGPSARAASLAVLGGLVIVAGTLFTQELVAMLEGAAALVICAGAFLRARRHGSLGARSLMVIGIGLGLAALVLEGGLTPLSIETFAIDDLAPALLQLSLGIVVLLPLMTFVDKHGPSGALAVATAWIVEQLAHAGILVARDGPTAPALGPMLAALVLPAAALGLAQAMPSAMRTRKATRTQDG